MNYKFFIINYHIKWPRAIFVVICSCKQHCLHDLSWIQVSVQSFISVSYLVFETRLTTSSSTNSGIQTFSYRYMLCTDRTDMSELESD